MNKTYYWLGAYHKLNKPGLGLTIKYRDPINRRRHVLQLSLKGRTFIQELKEILFSANYRL